MRPTGFCDLCDVSLDLHNGPDSCESAGKKADLLAKLDRVFGIGPRQMFPLENER